MLLCLNASGAPPAAPPVKKTSPASTGSVPAPTPSKPGATPMQWNVQNIDNRDYVTAKDIHQFYHFQKIVREGNSVWLRAPSLVMKASIGSQELLINNVKFILSYPVLESGGNALFSRVDLCKLLDPIFRPSYIKGKQFTTITLDAGHGGSDSGALSIFGCEKDYSLLLAGQLKLELEKKGFKVVLTREKDEFISLGGRVEIANKIPDSIFVSLHFNSGQSGARGIETYAISPQGTASAYGQRGVDGNSFTGNQRDSENIALATAVHASVMHSVPTVDRGVKRARWHVLTGLEKPGILFEGGFLTHGEESKNIALPTYRQQLAVAIASAITNYRNALTKG